MTVIKQLQVTSLRNLESTSLFFSQKINVFYGDNGSGKTSLLEAIALLGLGRSFRSRKTQPLIRQDAPELTVFAKLFNQTHETTLGIKKNIKGQTLIRADGNTVEAAASLAKLLPLQIINNDSFRLIEGPPQERRRFMDWLVFHVKPEFMGLWRKMQRMLKQRNHLLRHGKISEDELTSWDTDFVKVSELIHNLRGEVFADFVAGFSKIKEKKSSFLRDIDLHYYRGWDSEQELTHILKNDLERDRRDGYTHHGPQRAEFRVTSGNKAATDSLSRGQAKTLICELHMLQAEIYQKTQKQKSVFLVDDLLAELDQKAAKQLINRLESLGCQAFITGVNKIQLFNIWQGRPINLNMFHVEQGKIKIENELI